MTLEEYFDKNWKREPYAIIDHSLRIDKTADGKFTFYIHPSNVGGDTVDFVVDGNHLTTRQTC